MHSAAGIIGYFQRSLLKDESRPPSRTLAFLSVLLWIQADTPISRKQRHPFDRFYNFFSRSERLTNTRLIDRSLRTLNLRVVGHGYRNPRDVLFDILLLLISPNYQILPRLFTRECNSAFFEFLNLDFLAPAPNRNRDTCPNPAGPTLSRANSSPQ